MVDVEKVKKEKEKDKEESDEMHYDQILSKLGFGRFHIGKVSGLHG